MKKPSTRACGRASKLHHENEDKSNLITPGAQNKFERSIQHLIKDYQKTGCGKVVLKKVINRLTREGCIWLR